MFYIFIIFGTTQESQLIFENFATLSKMSPLTCILPKPRLAIPIGKIGQICIGNPGIARAQGLFHRLVGRR
eukprot:SAG11_NODE_8040_length_1066_cov_1.288521_1_plen_70_part_10